MQSIHLGSIATVFIVALQAQSALAATYYVAKTGGNDAVTCFQAQSESTPKLTLNSAVKCLTPGDTLLVKAGTYAEALINSVPSGTSWTKKVRVAAYPGHTVWLRPPSASVNRVLEFSNFQQYIEFDSVNLDGYYVAHDVVKINAGRRSDGSIFNAHHIRIKNAELVGRAGSGATVAGQQGVLATDLVGGLIGGNEFINLKVHRMGSSDFDHAFYIGSSNNLVEYCEMYDLAGNGVQLYNGYVSGAANNNTVRYNIIRDITRNLNGRHRGVIIGGDGAGNKIYGNLIYNIQNGTPPTAGIEVYDGVNSEIYNNTIFNVNRHGILVDPASSGTVIRNNIAFATGAASYENSGVNTASSHNLFGVNPLFVSSQAGDFRLMAGSPAIDLGTSIPLVSRDLIGTLRPQGAAYDIGAYEYVSKATTTTSTTTSTAPPAVTTTTAPISSYAGTPYSLVTLPGTIQAENYDKGGEGVAYHDTTLGNSGGKYRTDGVDIATSAEGGYVVGWVKTGEWLKYTVNVATSGTYTLSLRFATTQTRSLRIEVDGVDRTGAWSIPNTGGYSRYQTVSRSGLSLSAGKHVIRVYFFSDDIDLNWIRFQ